MQQWKIQGKLKHQKREAREEEVISLLLRNRDISKTQEKNFFNPQNPFDIKLKELDLDKHQVKSAIQKITTVLDKKEMIVVYGDYDADGICGTAIIWEVLNKFTSRVMPYLPNRTEEGYGLSKKGIDAVIKEYNPSLIITVDNGVTAKAAVEYANKQGIEVIITDHHVFGSEKPKPLALVHSTKISGTAVAWFLCRELIAIKKSVVNTGELLEKLALGAIGTVSDVLPLLDINRSIVYYGLGEIRKTRRPGLKALLFEAGIESNGIDTYHISYIIGPRINASGRITHALDSLRLLCTKSYSRAKDLAVKLGVTNRKRQKITEETLLHARDYVSKGYVKGKTKLLFASHSSYNQGIIGLVAGKLAEEFYRPAIVIAEGPTLSKASARSISGFNIISAIRQSASLLVDCGGHPMAAGFTIETTKISQFKKEFSVLAEKKLTADLLIKSIKVDCELNLPDITLSLYKKLEKFKPFGLGNPEPHFTTKNLQVLEARLVGKDGKHLKLRLADDQEKEINAIAFGKGEYYSKLNIKSEKSLMIDIVYTLIKNDWNGERLELKVKNIILNKKG